MFEGLEQAVAENWRNALENDDESNLLRHGYQQAAMHMIDCAADIGAYINEDGSNTDALIAAVEQCIRRLC